MKVSIAIVTYNHENFIAKALDSVLMQRVNFDYEVVVGEDCSTDNTRAILINYQKKYPDKLKLLLNDTNLGMHLNGKQSLEACKGDYIALLDGDDYWTSPDKLQKQVDFLDNHPECAICFHDSLILYADGSKEPTPYRPSQKAFSTVEDILLDNFIPTGAVIFRRGLYGKIPDWIGTLKMGDWLIHILNALHGQIGYIDETMAVYVVHRGGIWSTKDDHHVFLAILEMYEALDKHLGAKYSWIINRILRGRYFVECMRHESHDDLTGAITYANKSLQRHLLIITEPLRHANRGESSSINSLPHVVSVRSAELFRKLLRLYAKLFGSLLKESLRVYIPPLFKVLRAIARRLNFGIRAILLKLFLSSLQ